METHSQWFLFFWLQSEGGINFGLERTILACLKRNSLAKKKEIRTTTKQKTLVLGWPSMWESK
jgi:hypothetical protein